MKDLITKMRNQEAIINGLVRKDYLKILAYNKQCVIAPNHPTDSSEDEQLSSEGDHYTVN